MTRNQYLDNENRKLVFKKGGGEGGLILIPKAYTMEHWCTGGEFDN